CSIVYENEPMVKDAMQQKPRKMTETFLNWKELSISVFQGLIITLGVLVAYQYTVQNGGDEITTRAMAFTTLVFANILLSLVNRSLLDSVLVSFKYSNHLVPILVGATFVFPVPILYLPALAGFFQV